MTALSFGSGRPLILAAVLVAIYATQPVPDVIAAHRFLLVDNSGKQRAWLDVTPDEFAGKPMGGSSAELVMALPDGTKTVALSGAMAYTSSVKLLGKYPVAESPGLRISGADGQLTLTNTDLILDNGKHNDSKGTTLSAGNLRLSGSEPELTLVDTQGFSMDLGSTGTATSVTGATQKTSAASIVMFDNDKEHHVIWKAP